jgi:hypothetical protein
VVKAREGLPPNRQWVWIPLSELVGVSRLNDVLLD